MLARRALAFAIDYLIATALTVALLSAFVWSDPDKVRLTNRLIATSSCTTVETPPAPLAALVAPRIIADLALCDTRPLGVFNGRTARITLATDEGAAGPVLRVPVDGDGAPVNPIYPQGMLTWMILILGSALLVQTGRTTPGKRLAGLELGGTGCVLCRELRRVFPLLVLACLGLVYALIPVRNALMLADIPPLVLTGTALAAAAVILAYYAAPALRRDRDMPWDKATGLRVVPRNRG